MSAARCGRLVAAAVVFAFLTAGCGVYGPPVRTWKSAEEREAEAAAAAEAAESTPDEAPEQKPDENPDEAGGAARDTDASPADGPAEAATTEEEPEP